MAWSTYRPHKRPADSLLKVGIDARYGRNSVRHPQFTSGTGRLMFGMLI